MPKKKNNQEIILCGLIALAVLGLIFTIYNTFFRTAGSYNTASISSDQCGDLNNLSNVQHLSHHPDIYADCIKKVDAQKFYEAVGVTKEQYMKQNNIQ